jgi:predicted S18 family serine protease
MIMKNEKALQEFMAKVAEAQERLAELTAYRDNHIETSPENVTWGTVGNAGYIVEKLTEITDWAFKRGEYAE